jgi:hypothetical protein
MPQLLNQFDLKPSTDLDQFQAAWDAFVAHLLEQDLAASASPLMHRIHGSGFDTDKERTHTIMSTIRFRDDVQADVAWAAIETGKEPLGHLHRRVFAQVHNPIFTFWSSH